MKASTARRAIVVAACLVIVGIFIHPAQKEIMVLTGTGWADRGLGVDYDKQTQRIGIVFFLAIAAYVCAGFLGGNGPKVIDAERESGALRLRS